MSSLNALGDFEIELTPEEYALLERVKTGIGAHGTTSGRKELSKQGYSAHDHHRPVADMLKEGVELQGSFAQEAMGSKESLKNLAMVSWASAAIAAATCACHAKSCGTGGNYGCPIYRDTDALKMFDDGVKLANEQGRHVLRFNGAKIQKAFDLWFGKFPMGMTGRMCGDKALCMGACTFNDLDAMSEPVLISYFEAYLEEIGLHFGMFDKFYQPKTEKNGKSMAVVGAGPAGLMTAWKLLDQGYDVTLFEAGEQVGGTVRDGVPHDKYHKDYLTQIGKLLEKKGATFVFHTTLGDNLKQETLEATFDAVVLATGVAASPKPLRAEGADHAHVIPAMDYLREKNAWLEGLMELRATNPALSPEAYASDFPQPHSLRGKTVVIFGRGYTALDLQRNALRDMCPDGDVSKFDGKLHTVYYKGEGEEVLSYPHNTAKQEESATQAMLKYAQDAGAPVQQHYMLDAKRIETDAKGKITAIVFDRQEPTDKHVYEVSPEKAKYRVVGEERLEFGPEEDVVILTGLGYDKQLDPRLVQHLALEDAKVASNCTSRAGVFAAGDVAQDKHEVVHALNSAEKAAQQVDRWLRGEQNAERWQDLRDGKQTALSGSQRWHTIINTASR